MTRITSEPGNPNAPRIDRSAVVEFFETRAEKCEQLGPTRAVIYQDKHPDLAERRDIAEKALITPMLQLIAETRVLDLGCGTGRWTEVVASHCGYYHGVDVSEGLIHHAQLRYGHLPHVNYSVAAIDAISRASLGETEPFDRILCFGVLIYMNDDEVENTFKAIQDLAAERARIVFREPVGIPLRLTIKEHFSEDMEQAYNAIYRTESELMAFMERHLISGGFQVVGCGDVFPGPDMNNRADTRQRWFVLER